MAYCQIYKWELAEIVMKKLTLGLPLKQKQSLVMTPQLQQAIKLLQMTNMDIATFLEEQVLDNPFVEVTSPDKSNDSDKSNASDTDSQENAHDTLSDVDDSLNGASDLSSSIENGAALGDDPTAHSDLENRFGSEGLDLGRSAGGANAAVDSDWDDLAGLVADRPASLREFILRQVDLSITDTRQRFIAYELTDALEPSGWIGRSVEDVADMCTCTIDDVEDVLAVLQTLEPEGVFARDLAECLYIQAREQVSTGCLKRWLHVEVDRLASLKSRSKQIIADSNELALAA